ncbi:MAG: hypothetical protein IT384_19555 [Deltaproteobacteria bacterium]|nr:hypothetical protein [Deltaproteobacteria bacterium]
MMIRRVDTPLFALLAAALVPACGSEAATGRAQAQSQASSPARGAGDPEETDEPEAIPFKTTKLLIEHNTADEDTGFQLFLDGEPWRRIDVRNPRGQLVLTVTPRGKLRQLGLTEMFLESNEPPNAEVPIPEVLSNLPEGRYEFEGITIDGNELEGQATLSHRIPAAPEVSAPSGTDVAHDVDQVFSWTEVTTALHGGTNAAITHYQLIVNKLNQIPGPGFGAETVSIHVPASVRTMRVPAEFLLPSTDYEWEVHAIEENGNQSFAHGTFTTRS